MEAVAGASILRCGGCCGRQRWADLSAFVRRGGQLIPSRNLNYFGETLKDIKAHNTKTLIYLHNYNSYKDHLQSITNAFTINNKINIEAFIALKKVTFILKFGRF